ncbi:uncharacterized protein LOC122850604 [Aphidius gifuensis]|nr:uncharacterized protein LOC122850604 [Aphidius gifuensis]
MNMFFDIEAYEDELKANQEFRTDTKIYMQQLIEEDYSLPNCTRKILRAFFTQKIAMKLTLTRKRNKKIVMSDDLPHLKGCILDVLSKKFKSLSNIKDRCLTILSQCLTRASDWDNHRREEKKKNNGKSLADYVAEELREEDI